MEIAMTDLSTSTTTTTTTTTPPRRGGRERSKSRILVFGSEAELDTDADTKLQVPEVFEAHNDWRIGRRRRRTPGRPAPSAASPTTTSVGAAVMGMSPHSAIAVLSTKLDHEMEASQRAQPTKPLCCMPCVVKRPAITCSTLVLLVIGLTVATVFGTTLDDIDVSIDSFSLDSSHFSVQQQDGVAAARTDSAHVVSDYKGRRWLTARDDDGELLLVERAEHSSAAAAAAAAAAAVAGFDEHGAPPQRRRLATQYLLGYLEVLYMPRDEPVNDSAPLNFLTEDNFERIHALERLVLESEDFTKYCLGSDLYTDTSGSSKAQANDYTMCNPPSSILSYFYPSIDNVTGDVAYDGYGDVMLPFSVTLSVLAGVESAYSFLSSGSSFASRDTKFLKTLFTFAVPFRTSTDEFKNISADFDDFLE